MSCFLEDDDDDDLPNLTTETENEPNTWNLLRGNRIIREENLHKSMQEAWEEERKLEVECGEIDRDGIPLITVIAKELMAIIIMHYLAWQEFGITAVIVSAFPVHLRAQATIQERLKQCHGISAFKMKGQKLSADNEAAEKFIHEVEKLVSDTNLIFVEAYNAYETALYLHCMPLCSLYTADKQHRELKDCTDHLKEVTIGQCTGKLLFMSVCNKYCCICEHAANRNASAPSHLRYKNWGSSRPSTTMEQDIIIEGFNKSEEIHGVRFKYFVGDGDSSVYARLMQNCINYTGHLHKLATDKNFSVQNRNILKSLIPSLMAAARRAIRHCGILSAAKAPQLINNMMSNYAEHFMSLVAKYNSGKRINFSQRGSFQQRCNVASLHFKKGHEWEASTFKKLTGNSQGEIHKKIINKKRHHTSTKKRRSLTYTEPVFKRKKMTASLDADYGPNVDEPEDPDELERKCKAFLSKLTVSESEIDKIMHETIGQSDNIR
ncbi:hypothetical protein PR048_001307 [Dryococelus australis]|uniref:Mutator-like transposase domain-containing protein n=1 Tax=Dryococelus australis TaxID=614101 RepID=A0ABQ9IH49_9NEOP|nr:hypothetical protein PR048_001307 [Dryococelus australis]